MTFSNPPTQLKYGKFNAFLFFIFEGFPKRAYIIVFFSITGQRKVRLSISSSFVFWILFSFPLSWYLAHLPRGYFYHTSIDNRVNVNIHIPNN